MRGGVADAGILQGKRASVARASPRHEPRVPNRSRRSLLRNRRLAETVRRLVRGLNPERIILFGSLASGEAGRDSDADLLVLKRTRKRWLERGWQAEKALGWDRPMATDVIVLTPEEYERWLAGGDPILREIGETGVVLYERAG